MNKTKLLEAIKSVQKDNGPKNVKNLANKSVLVKEMKGGIKAKPSKNDEIKDVILTKFGSKLESEWKPKITNVSDLTQRVLIEAEINKQKQPNAFRLNLQPIVMNNTHAKFSASRANKTAIVELLYPNANGKISVKIQIDGSDDKLTEVGLEDKAYRLNFGEYIIRLIDETILDSRNAETEELNNYMYGGNQTPEKPNPEAPMGTVNDRGSNSVLPVGGPTWESDMRTMNELISLIEADEKPKVEDDAGGDDAGGADAGSSDSGVDAGSSDSSDSSDSGAAAEGADAGSSDDGSSDAGSSDATMESDLRTMNKIVSLIEADDDELKVEDAGDVDTDAGDAGAGDAGDAGAGDAGGDVGGFGEDDFSIDAGADTTTSDSFGSDFGLGGGGDDFGGGGDDKKSGDINAEGGPSGEETEFFTFRDKSDWLQSSLDTMQNLIAQSMGQKMKEGKGVILTSDEIINGTAGMRNVDKPIDIIDKFLKIYPELDEIDLKSEDLEQIDEKLSLNDNQFDGWLAQKLPEFRGEDEVNKTVDTLDNSMFTPMGGEQTQEPESEQGMGGDFQDFLDSTAPAPTETKAERKAAEMDLGLPPSQNEFTKIGKDEPKEEENAEK